MENQEKKLFRMKHLRELTGLSRATVKYYIDFGLLPKPVMLNRNTAFYDESHLENIRIIKELQEKCYFPLSAELPQIKCYRRYG